MKRNYILISIIFSLLYVILVIFLINILIYTRTIEGLFFWFATLIINLFLSDYLIIKKECKYIFLRSVIFTIINNFLLIGLIVLLSSKPIRYSGIFNFLTNQLSVWVEIFISANWILPIIITTFNHSRNISKLANLPPCTPINSVINS